MKVRFEYRPEKCEVCGKPAKWQWFDNAKLDNYVAEAHYYCDKCHAKKYKEK